MKTCPKCEVEKPFEEFFQDRRRKDGRDALCKGCRRDRVTLVRGERPNKLMISTGESVSEIPERLAVKATQVEKYNCRVWVWFEGRVYRFGRWDEPGMDELQWMMKFHGKWEELR